MIKFGQKMEVYDPFIWKRGLVFNESEEPIGFGPNIQCPGIVNDTIRKSRLMDLKQRKNAKKVRKESKNVVNVTVTEDHEYNIEDVLQNLELSEASSKKSKRKKKKKGDKKSAQEDKEQNSAQDQDPDPDPVCKEEEPIMIKNAFSGPECSTCFEPRIRTYLLLPCGHATFCEKCAIFIFFAKVRKRDAQHVEQR